MLQLQRASAGSGKTYMLAKKFIQYFISYKSDDGRRRLRPPRMLRDSLTHILAITFTNKATNEMKLRIVDKLDALAHWTPDIPTRKIDYLDEFSKEFDAAPADIAPVCESALQILLNDYGDFKVSTIDSFFQTVLRTFAYEADLDDTYQIELDSDYVARTGLDSTLDEMELAASPSSAGPNTGSPSGARRDTTSGNQGTAWIDSMMEQLSAQGRGWNIFQKRERAGNIYSEILKASKNITKEDFMLIREDLDEYFKTTPDFFSIYHQLKAAYEDPLKQKHARMKKAALSLIDGFEQAALDIDVHAGQYLADRARAFSKWKADDKEARQINPPVFDRKGSRTRVFNPKQKSTNPHLDTPTEDHLERLAIEMYDRYLDWYAYLSSPTMTKWKIYSRTLPLLGLLQAVRENSLEFLTGINSVELAETNSILGRIIADEDAPFVYERLGSRLEHFLIDEFQDTSRLQWKNLRPLLAESEGKGNDNLIIGDAKQSIYRFRNAEPRLITHDVPEQFKATVRECGDTPQENTNWRSMRRIVEFNNLFFRHLSHTLQGDMETLYSNTVQPPHHREDAGYVEVRMFDASDKDEENTPVHFRDIPLMIADMLDRGYRQSDIAVLVKANEDGRRIIDSIMAYNRQPDASHKIDFISADSLSVGDSPAVMTIVSVLESIDKGTRAELRSPEESRKKGIGDWSKIKANFSFFAMSHRDLSLSEQMRRFLQGDYDPDAVSDMLAAMQTTVLPALVENISEKFLPETLRDSQAPFLAAFQDIVIEFCESHSADLASFLDWWNKKGKFRSISSPEDADAVQIMTIHKSKGLEFRCVIIPNSKQTLTPQQHEDEWLWVKPDFSEVPGIPAPPWIPVWSLSKLEETPHLPVKQSYLTKYLADQVNSAYVAYTRAIDELYIFGPVSRTPRIQETRLSRYLWECGLNATDIISGLQTEYPGIENYIPDASEISIDEDLQTWTVGHKPDRQEVLAATASRRKSDSGITSTSIDRYPSSSALPQLQYRDPSMPEGEYADEQHSASELPEETEEQRRRGEILHRVMERVAVPSDLHASLQRMKSRGFISYPEMLRLEVSLGRALASVERYGWFAPGLRLFNERGLMTGGYTHRPDRVILHSDGSATIIDYKFGEHRADSAYKKQLRRYADALRATGLAQKSEAYIWYVSLGDVVRVDV